ncbi:hypothetical protein [Winogradskyella sp.]|uniref:hypothetical protein n=1 Tax=Winogradskyella sp. TaxID=1883156 RepID=UPI0025CEDE2C|nr:hypothetical protein [Winogradskyella sp.]
MSDLFKTIATSNDLVWPYENWPAMRFKDGLKIGRKGGHGRVRYTIIDFNKGDYIKFKFSKPDGFNGTHELRIEEITLGKTEISHEIRMNTSFKATFFWIFIIRWLHDALIEDAFDKIENYFLIEKKQPKHSNWVEFLRGAYKIKSFKTKHA